MATPDGDTMNAIEQDDETVDTASESSPEQLTRPRRQHKLLVDIKIETLTSVLLKV